MKRKNLIIAAAIAAMGTSTTAYAAPGMSVPSGTIDASGGDAVDALPNSATLISDWGGYAYGGPGGGSGGYVLIATASSSLSVGAINLDGRDGGVPSVGYSSSYAGGGGGGGGGILHLVGPSADLATTTSATTSATSRPMVRVAISSQPLTRSHAPCLQILKPTGTAQSA